MGALQLWYISLVAEGVNGARNKHFVSGVCVDRAKDSMSMLFAYVEYEASGIVLVNCATLPVGNVRGAAPTAPTVLRVSDGIGCR
jgi:hypothetical protein